MVTDLNRRHRQPEIMDAPDLPAPRFTETLEGLKRVNVVTMSSRLMWPDVKAAAAVHPDRPLRVLDVACGGGDVLIALWRKACRVGLKLELAGCDLSPEAVRHAGKAAAKADASIRVFAHDVTRTPLPEGFDLIMSTLFLHHLDEQDAIAFLRDAAHKAKERVVIQDLTRSRLSYWFARLGTSVLLLNDICRLDGRTSVEGAFTVGEAKDLVRKAGLEGAEVVPRLPFRYLIRWIRR
ncbi:MAG TPA: methyltransferase domain-containing protein [Methyloceanibacter sp.]|jgi:SAM-dependent methyltransferase|nr:methyltransferase domain-containing protein [Methyloceanibacter sp.]